ncbi:deaminase domain-containing protein [Capnocytophaga canis]|uniref:deaminase domain-containing protein n=1 Tax=Capnocytophaga canis TaxID=1848903 RepID=UPI001562C21B|nr:deaminase domain-containing protein [Capnocytophaga canis]
MVITQDLGAEKGKAYPYITGELKIVSERAYCLSCQGIIQQFNTMFPNIKIILIDGVK